MNKVLQNPKLRQVSTWIVSLTLLSSAMGKGLDLTRSARSLEAILSLWRGEPSQGITIISVLLIGAIVTGEVGLAWGLIVSRRRLLLIRLTAGIMAVFILFEIIILISHLSHSCPCFGIWGELPIKVSLTITLVLFVLSLLLLSPVPLISAPLHTRRILSVPLALLLLMGLANIPTLSLTPTITKGKRFPTSLYVNHNISHLSDPILVWFFHPRCSHCVESYQRWETTIKALSSDRAIIGITAASQGEVEEFKIDFNPPFPIISVPQERAKDWALPLNVWLKVKGEQVEQIYRPYQWEKGVPTL